MKLHVLTYNSLRIVGIYMVSERQLLQYMIMILQRNQKVNLNLSSNSQRPHTQLYRASAKSPLMQLAL